MGIIPRGSYLQAMGWVYRNGKLNRVRYPHPGTFPLHIQNTGLTATNLVDHARDQGYFVPRKLPPLQLMHACFANSLVAPTPPANTVASVMMVQAPAATADPNDVAGSTTQDQSTPSTSTEESTATPQAGGFESMRDCPDPTIFDARALVEPNLLLAQSNDQYPFGAQFIPEDEGGLYFDPHAVDEHASYDLEVFIDPTLFLDTSLYG